MQTEKVLSPKELKKLRSATALQHAFVENSRKQLVDILEGRDARLVLIVGPCSIHDLDSAREYAARLKGLAEDVSNEFFLIMRTYFEKPRTATGWKGLVYDPHCDDTHDMTTGLDKTRQLLLELASMNIPVATEFLDPITAKYIDDLVTWGCIGARTAESQVHRQFASGLSIPVAFKNSTSGDIDVAVNAIVSASNPHTGFGIDENGMVSIIRTSGTPYAHIVLRGGKNRSNYDAASINRALFLLQQANLPERVLIDCAHGNSMKDHLEQCSVFDTVLEHYVGGISAIRGLLLEGHLFDGTQKIPADPAQMQYGISLTDPCLNWNCTEKLIRSGAAMLRQKFLTETPAEVYKI